MRPGPLLPRLLLGLAAAALLAPALPGALPVLVTLLVALLLASGADAWWLHRVRISLERDAAVVLTLGNEARIDVTLRTNAGRPVRLALRQIWPDLVSPSTSLREAHLRPAESLRLELPVRAVARGSAPLGAPYVSLLSWGLAERVVAAGPPARLSVLPDLNAVGRLHARLNQAILRGLGSRSAPRLGKGREFDRLREYVPGDDIRDIAWKASARHSKLIAREYRLERAQDVLICLDAGHRMQARVRGLSKLDHGVNAAVLLAYICSRMEDRVGLVSFATEPAHGAPFGRGAAHLRRFTAFATAVEGGAVHTDYLALAADLRRRLRHRTLVLVLTALAEVEQRPLVRAVRLLAPRHLPFVLVLSDPDLEAASRVLPSGKPALARTLAALDLASGREQTIRELRGLGALVVEAAPEEAGVSAVNEYLDIKRRQLL
jgi:uncharacterized protein (DUF58 family)